MSSLGRGRARALKQYHGRLRRPGESSFVWDLVKAIDCMEISEPTTSNDDTVVVLIADKLKEKCTSADILEQMVNGLHHYSLQSSQFGRRYAAVLGEASMFCIDGSKLRSVLLTRLQLDYEEHEKIEKRDPSKFLNMAYFLGQVFQRVRLNDGSHMQVLAGPHITYLGILLQGREKQLEIFTSLMLLNGRALQEFNELEFKELLNQVRATMMMNNLAPSLNACLMATLEYSNYGFKDVPEDISKFYCSHIKYPSILQFLIPQDCVWAVNETKETNENIVATSEKRNRTKFVNSHDDRHEVSYENPKSVNFTK